MKERRYLLFKPSPNYHAGGPEKLQINFVWPNIQEYING